MSRLFKDNDGLYYNWIPVVLMIVLVIYLIIIFAGGLLK